VPKPIENVLPDFVINFLVKNPTQSMSYYEAVDTQTGKTVVQFFIKANSSDLQYLSENPNPRGLFSLAERSDSEYPNGCIFAKAIFFESEFVALAPGVEYAISPGIFTLESEFDPENLVCLNSLELLVAQPHWDFVLVNNACTIFYNTKRFPNPLDKQEREKWLYRIRRLKINAQSY